MTLSQIIARGSYYDVEVPDEGTWKIRVIIQKGKVKHQSITEEREEE